MIVVFHKHNKVLSIFDYDSNTPINLQKTSTIFVSLQLLAKQYPDRVIGWCLESLKENIVLNNWKEIFHHKLIFASFDTNLNFNLNKKLGYINASIFLNINKENRYSTWVSSTDVGATSAYVLNSIKINNPKKSFLFTLNVVAKTSIIKGVFCYSEPKLIHSTKKNSSVKKEISELELLVFIKSVYKKRWTLMYLLNVLLYEKRVPLGSFIRSIFIKKMDVEVKPFKKEIKSIKKSIEKTDFTVDVVIPTLGRKKYLYDVLKDLEKQTIVPKKVIIVEQNVTKNSISELDYLSKESWSFQIDHTFTHQLGACNARNIALSKVTGNWVFFADDDILFDEFLLENSLKTINKLGADCLTYSCLQKEETEKMKTYFQWQAFGTNASIVETAKIGIIKFAMEHEFGYGEDVDFGKQLKNAGCDNIYVPFISLLHLKAPSGGFRAKYIQKWHIEKLQPKPSPTIMAFNLKHKTPEQLLGYKTILFIKFYKLQAIKNPFKYVKKMNNAWNISEKWANKLMKK